MEINYKSVIGGSLQDLTNSKNNSKFDDNEYEDNTDTEDIKYADPSIEIDKDGSEGKCLVRWRR
jgi:hypothetical protein